LILSDYCNLAMMHCQWATMRPERPQAGELPCSPNLIFAKLDFIGLLQLSYDALPMGYYAP